MSGANVGQLHRILLLQIDGKLPNLALMRIASHHRALGNSVEFRRGIDTTTVLGKWDIIYGSVLFSFSRPKAERLLALHPNAVIGGTGWDTTTTLSSFGIVSKPDYFIYPNFKQSIGFTQRGCRMKCKFCIVPGKEGQVSEVATIQDIWRGDPWPREILLLDNDFFGQPNWQKRIDEIREGNFKVSFNQGINARFLNSETAAAIASVNFRDDSMRYKRLYTAWDNRKDETRLFNGLQCLVDAGVPPSSITVYVLIGFWNGAKITEDDLYRVHQLRQFGCFPYPMPYTRTRELMGFKKWVTSRFDCRGLSWEDWKRLKFNQGNLHQVDMLVKKEPSNVRYLWKGVRTVKGDKSRILIELAELLRMVSDCVVRAAETEISRDDVEDILEKAQTVRWLWNG